MEIIIAGKKISNIKEITTVESMIGDFSKVDQAMLVKLLLNSQILKLLKALVIKLLKLLVRISQTELNL